jgi:hypothetical protein
MKMNILIFALLFIGSCTRNKQINNVNNVNIPILEKPKDLFNEIVLVPLETNDSSLIGNINKIYIDDTSIYILDSNQKSLFVFSNKGKYLHKLHKVGRGPGEYVHIADFNVNSNGDIEILDSYKIITYNNQLEYVNEFNIPTVAHYFCWLDEEHIILYHLQAQNRISLYNWSTKKILYESLHNPKYSRMLPNSYYPPFYKSGEDIYLEAPFSNDIYQVTHDGLKKIYTFFESSPIDLSKLPDNKGRKFYFNYIMDLKEPIVSNSFVCSKYKRTYVKNGSEYFHLFIMENKNFQFKNLLDSIKYSGFFGSEEFTYGSVEATEAIKYIKYKNELNLKLTQSDSTTTHLSPSQNPLIIKYYLKY